MMTNQRPYTTPTSTPSPFDHSPINVDMTPSLGILVKRSGELLVSLHMAKELVLLKGLNIHGSYFPSSYFHFIQK